MNQNNNSNNNNDDFYSTFTSDEKNNNNLDNNTNNVEVKNDNIYEAFYQNKEEIKTSENNISPVIQKNSVPDEVKPQDNNIINNKYENLRNKFKNKTLYFKIMSIFILLLVFGTITIIVFAELKLIKLPWLDYPEVLTLSQNELTIKNDAKYQFSSYVYPSQVHYGKIIYESSDPTVADINSITGYVEAKKNGVTTIKAYIEDDKDVYDTCELVVSNSNVLVESISVPTGNVDMLVGSIYMLKYEYYPKNAGLHYFSYISSDNSIVSVNNKGEVTALNTGKAIVTIIEEVSGNVTQQEFTIYDKGNFKPDEKYIVSGIKVSSDDIGLIIGGEYKIEATVLPLEVIQSITWSSLDSNIVTVSNDGLIKAIDYGKTQIIATAVDGTNKVINVEVIEEEIPVSNFEVSESIRVDVGNSKKISFKIEPKNASDQKIEWISDNPTIATVEENGTVNGIAVGNTIIKAMMSDGNIVRETKVVVTKTTNSIAAKDIKLSHATVNLNSGSSINVTATIVPSNASNKKIKWTSDNPTIATVSNGMIYGKSPGTTYITVTSNTISKKIKVDVNSVIINSITLNQKSAKLGIGAEVKLYVNFNPSTSTNKKITWTSSNSNVASVNSSGLVTTKGVGTAIITATTFNSKTASCTITVTNEKIQVSSIKLSSNQYSVKVNGKVGITPIISPSNATNQKITLTSSNNNIATVASDGSVKGIKEGVVEITAKTNNGKTAKAFVIVKNKNSSVNYLNGSTIKYWYDNTYKTYAITHIWVRNAYNQFKTEIPNKFGTLANAQTLTQKAAKKNSGKTIIAVNGSGYVSSSTSAELYKVNKAWGNTSVSPIVIYEGKVLRDYTSYDLPYTHIRMYGMTKNGVLNHYYYSKTKEDNNGIAKGMLNDGIKYTFGWYPILVLNNKIQNNLSKDPNIRQSICQIDSNNFLFITNISSNRSKGFSPYSLANKMVELGCQSGYNLDGGGSTSIYYVKKGSSSPTKIRVMEGSNGRAVADIVYFVGD